MSLNIFDHSSDSTSIKDSFVYNGLRFDIRPANICTANGKLWNSLVPKIDNKTITEVHGIADDTAEIGYTTTWSEGPGASIVKKVKEFTNAEAFRLFGGPNRISNPATNGWTQKFPTDGSRISLSFSFRAYERDDFLSSTSYLTLIKWLTYVTSPLDEFSFNTEIRNIGSSLSNAKRSGEDFGKELNLIMDNNKNIDLEQVEKVIKSIETLLESLSGNSRGTITFYLNFGKIIKQVPGIDWIIKSWDFKPSVQYGPNNMPLYVDFNISLETVEKLTTDTFMKLFKLS